MPAEPTYTFSGDPSSSDIDAVRIYTADTNPDGKGWLMSDQTILWALKNEGSQRAAAAQCCELIAGLYTGPKRNIALRRIGDLTLQAGRASRGNSEDWYALANALRRRIARGAVPSAGGINIIDREDASDQSLLKPSFARGMTEFGHGLADLGPGGFDIAGFDETGGDV